MADAITTTSDDGQAIPAALAATPASTRMRKAPRAAKVASPVVEAGPAPIDAAQVDSTPIDAAPVEATPVQPALPEPEPVSTPTAAVSAEPQKEPTMATTIENAAANTTDKAQAMFADASERTKGALAKSAKLFEEANAFGKGNVEALVESSKIAAKGFESLGQDAAEFGRKSFEDATAVFKTLATVKSPTEFLKLQGDFVRQSFDALVAETSRSTETVLKLAGEVAQPISNRFAVAAEKMKPVA